MKSNVERDFILLRGHLQSLRDLRDGFVAGPPRKQDEDLTYQLVPVVWDQIVRNQRYIRISVISTAFEQVAVFTVDPPVEGEIKIHIERSSPAFRDVQLSNCVADTVDWLENSIGGGKYAFEGELFASELEMFKRSFWKEIPAEDSEARKYALPAGPPLSGKVSLQINLNDCPDDGGEVLTAGPSISAIEISFSDSAVRTGWNNKHSDYISAFENEVAGFLGVRHALATSSCTGALHLSLLAAGVGPGDEVLVPEITWVASGSVVQYVGATPIFVDVDPNSWTIMAEQVRKLVSPRTKAIIPVHLYGFPAQMSKIMAIADEHGLTVIEDAAPALGAKSGDKSTGTFGSFGCFSFQGAKMLVTGEGGMLVTNSEELFSKAKQLQEHGRRPGTFWIEKLGYKYKMSNVQAALGLGQVSRVLNQIERKREVSSWYREFLDEFPGVSFQTASSDDFSVDWMTSVKLEGKLSRWRDKLIEHLKKSGIDSRPVFPQMSRFSMWNSDEKPENQIAHQVASSALNLPSGVNLKKQTVRRVAEEILRFSSE